MSRRALIAVAAVAIAAAGSMVAFSLLAGSDGDPTAATTVADVTEGPAELVVDGWPSLKLWVVTTDEARAAGVNGHRLARGEGMWFGWDAETYSAFWMRGVEYPLLLAWVGSNRKVIGIGRMEPCHAIRGDCPLYEPPQTYRYAIELLPEDLERSRLRAGALVGMRALES